MVRFCVTYSNVFVSRFLICIIKVIQMYTRPSHTDRRACLIQYVNYIINRYGGCFVCKYVYCFYAVWVCLSTAVWGHL